MEIIGYLTRNHRFVHMYDDSNWISCSKTSANNSRDLSTPTNFHAMDYGFHTGSLIYRGEFTGNGQELNLWLNISGGTVFGHSAWLNDIFLGSWTGTSTNSTAIQDIPITKDLLTGSIQEGGDQVSKRNLNNEPSGHNQTDTSCKVTRKFGGE
ncbi:Glycoside hydrolase family 35 [Penicillium odoratum]|uniref:Glycoside hydrolase family 35 n=1 Tax=Penicillium odoratum TaxID=1167516 RepID=UPI0025498CD3|nr:Glycoside hydrolase family 35 [Penicillium odoratum]KAJ5752577.1 Glycoside hydrolase family 35 [Penicillium odoratum]